MLQAEYDTTGQDYDGSGKDNYGNDNASLKLNQENQFKICLFIREEKIFILSFCSHANHIHLSSL